MGLQQALPILRQSVFTGSTLILPKACFLILPVVLCPSVWLKGPFNHFAELEMEP